MIGSLCLWGVCGMVACVREMKWREEEGRGVLEFRLGKGVYATTMLRELSGGCWSVCCER